MTLESGAYFLNFKACANCGKNQLSISEKDEEEDGDDETVNFNRLLIFSRRFSQILRL